MAWTYDPTLFNSLAAGTYAASTIGLRYQIRLLIQDTRTTRQLLQDEEIDWFQTQEMNVYTMAAAACESLVARGGGIKFKKISEFSESFDIEFYRTLAGQLRSRGMGYQMPYAGGISSSDKATQQDDSDWVIPSIVRGLGDNPTAISSVVSEEDPLTSL